MGVPSNDSPEREPLLGHNSINESSHTATASKQPQKRSIWPSYTTISPKYKWIPLLGCSLIFINEAEYFVKQVATLRAIEAMYCYEFYLARGSDLADLGKHIPERFCKDDSIQKGLAKTAGLIMFVRMLSAMIGAVPLGWAADRYGRKLVVILHKVNVTISCATWLVLCKFACGLLKIISLTCHRPRVPQSSHLDTLSQWSTWTDWRKLRRRARDVVCLIYRCHAVSH
jgi:hypothetical protein